MKPKVWNKCFLIIVATLLNLEITNSSYAAPIKSYRELRYDSVVGQTNFYTCGPAAVATLFTHYYGVPTTEDEILKVAETAMGVDEKEKEPKSKGVNALGLKKALLSKGVESEGMKITPENLTQYFKEEGGLPIILHVTKPQLHYVLAIGMIDDWLIVADPSVGQGVKKFSSWKIEKGFNGVALVPIPDTEEWIANAENQQQKALSWATDRVNRLNLIKRRNP